MSLDIRDLSHTYSGHGVDDRTVLQTISAAQLADGDQVLLRGISGSGKTTLLNILAGILQPSTGSVTLNDQSLYELSEAKRDRYRNQHIGYVYQNHYLLPTLSAMENVAMPLAFAGRSKQDREQQALDLLAAVDVEEFATYRPAQLSTGQRMRVAAVRALANHPHLLLADEPTAALDQDAAVKVMDLLQQTCSELGAILIVASHDPGLGDRFSIVWDLNEGQLSVSDTTALASST